MKSQSLLLVVAVLALLRFDTQAGATFIVNSWTLGIQVDDASAGQFVQHGFFTPQSPFMMNHMVSLPTPQTSLAQSAYNFLYTDMQGSFHFDASHAAYDVSSAGLDSSSDDRFTVVPSGDPLLVTFNGQYHYVLPPDSMYARFTAGVYDITANATVFAQGSQANSFSGHLTTGTFVINGQATLPPGHSYSIQTNMQVSSFGGGTGQLATGSGFLDIQIIPEPGTVLLLIPTAVLAIMRRKR